MSVDRSRLSSAVPDGPVPGIAKSPHLPMRRLAVAVMAVGFLGTAVAGLSAQFPAPARPPKLGGQAPAPKSAEARPAQLPSARSILDKHLAAIGGRQAVLSHKSTHATGTLSMPVDWPITLKPCVIAIASRAHCCAASQAATLSVEDREHVATRSPASR